jgi:TonB-linked SusC/RagA family outer membrane protein
MKTKFKGILMLLLAFVVQLNFAQEKTVSGTVSDTSGSLPGVSVLVKGTTRGTETDFDGKYTITAKEGDILTFSYIGYKSIDKVLGSTNTINVTLAEDTNTLDEIFITGLGISKKEKAIGYAVQKVDGEQINQAKEPNLVNSLQGRLSGVQIQGTNSSLGGSSRITIRGSNSFLGNNQPLFIVDGVPISNNSFSTSAQERGFGGGAYDYGNSAAEIDPSNIQSMSVLKGAAATAIYGSRGANGVILIITKSGKNQKGIGVSFDSSVTFDNVRNLIPIQSEYGGGSIYPTTSGFNEFNQDGMQYLAPNYAKDGSWGPKFNPNVSVRHWDSWDPGAENYKETRPWVAPENSYETFFDTGITLSNSVAFSGGNEDGAFRASFTNLDVKGTMPNGVLVRNTLSFNSNYNLSDKLKAGVAMTYINTEAQNRNATGYSNANPLQGFTQWWQAQLDVDRLKNQQNTTEGSQFTWNPIGIVEDGADNLTSFNPNANYFDNPSWVRNNYLQEDTKNRLYGNANLSYEISDDFTIATQFGTDLYQFSVREGVPLRSVDLSKYSETERRFQETNIEVRLQYEKEISTDFSVNAFLGANQMKQFSKSTSLTSAGGIVVDRFFNISNSAEAPIASTTENQRGINSIFATAAIAWKDMLFLDVTARNDWSSTLPDANNSYFYPSASLSFAVSELDAIKESTLINFAKLRVSLAQAGSDGDPYRLTDVYNPITPSFGSLPMYSVPNSRQNPNLVNELTTEFEIGFLVKLFDSRVSIDAAYYDRTTDNQIFNVPVSASTGYTSRLLNAGTMRNSGLELQINTTPIKVGDFRWDVGLNLTKQNNEVVELLKDEDGNSIVESINMGGTWAADLRIQEGLPYMALFGQDYVRDENGSRLVDANGVYQFTSDRVYLGSAIADWTGGFSTAFSYKGFTLSGLLDFQVGGILHSSSLQWSKYSGMHPETVAFNGESDTRANGMILPGVKENGEPNDISIDPQGYFQSKWRVAVPNTYDASFLNFREVRLNYGLSAALLQKLPVTALNVSLFGRNLGLLSSNVPYIDPQVITGAGNTQGLENAQIPATRSFGINVSAKF